MLSAGATEFDFGMHHAHVSCQGIVSRKRFVLGAEMTPDLLLACVVDGVFVAGEVVRAREDGVAGLAGRRVDAVAFVGTCLAVAHERHILYERCLKTG
jgi:hypothetical protein